MDPRVAVVTGGGTGIGRAVAAAFAKQGDKVVILGRRAEVLQQTAEELGVRWRQADVSRREEVEAAVRWVVADVGPAIAWLAAPEAAYVNGEVHHVNGGWLFGR
jgi:NAD(P)-dependent dehydrogenase (short-subunit alcohol dehydrogenase family)